MTTRRKIKAASVEESSAEISSALHAAERAENFIRRVADALENWASAYNAPPLLFDKLNEQAMKCRRGADRIKAVLERENAKL